MSDTVGTSPPESRRSLLLRVMEERDELAGVFPLSCRRRRGFTAVCYMKPLHFNEGGGGGGGSGGWWYYFIGRKC